MVPLLTTQDLTRKLGVPYYRIHYLFSSGRLNSADYGMVNRSRVYTPADVAKIRRALRSVNGKGKR